MPGGAGLKQDETGRPTLRPSSTQHANRRTLMLADLHEALSKRGLTISHTVPDPVVLLHRKSGALFTISLQPFDASKATFLISDTQAPVIICQGYLGSDPRGFPLFLPTSSIPHWFSSKHESYARAQGLHGAQVLRVDRLFHAPECAQANAWAWQPAPFQNAWHIFDRYLDEAISKAQAPQVAAQRPEQTPPKTTRGKRGKK